MYRIFLAVVITFFFISPVPPLQAGEDDTGEVDADIQKANSYDDEWEAEWVTHLREIHKRAKNKTPGFVIHLGDSITHAAPYATLAMQHHSSDEFGKVLDWSKGGSNTVNPNDVAPDDKNGWFLAVAHRDVYRAGYTAVSGITDEQWLYGERINQGKTHFASGPDDKHPLDTLLDNTSTEPYPGGNTVAVVQDAEICVIMLGTNNLWSGPPPKKRLDRIRENLGIIIDKLEAKDIMPVISTIPPFKDNIEGVTAINGIIRTLAREKKIPLIDFHSEILRRRPGESWKGTLIGGEFVHPTSGAYANPSQNPAVLSSNGYLLRMFLSVSKLMEIKSYVYEGKNPAGGGTGSASAVFLTEELPAAESGEAFSFKVEVKTEHGPCRFQAFGLPRGLKISRDGEIHGTPKKAGEYKVKVKASPRRGGPQRKYFTLVVK